jgi:hypothetical protein
MKKLILQCSLALVLAMLTVPSAVFAASHREAPITALDQKADITDWFTFVSFDHPDRVTMILNVDPFLEPSNGPNYFPFDPNILYEMKVDNNNDGVEDLIFQFRFKTETRLPDVFTGFVGGLAGIPPILSLDGPDSQGLGERQTYTVTLVKEGVRYDLGAGRTLIAVPTNVGPRTMPKYLDLYNEGIYDLGNGVRVFAGTIADPFFIDLGAAFDSLNFRKAAGSGVLTAAQDGDDKHNFAPNSVAGFNVNTIVLEVPITQLTRDGKLHSASEKEAVIGTYGSTSRRKITIRRTKQPALFAGEWRQVQRMGNPLINELLIGTGSKDRWSMDEPENDGQFANFFLHPLLADIFASIAIPVPSGPRTDLLPVVQYRPPICPGCGESDAGPVADLLRLNTGIKPTPLADQKRLGFLVGDLAGFPNGRRPVDDVVDISARAVAGILADPVKFGTRIGDGVNNNALPLVGSFPYVQPALNGRDSAHSGPGLPGCNGTADGICPVD